MILQYAAIVWAFLDGNDTCICWCCWGERRAGQFTCSDPAGLVVSQVCLLLSDDVLYPCPCGVFPSTSSRYNVEQPANVYHLALHYSRQFPYKIPGTWYQYGVKIWPR